MADLPSRVIVQVARPLVNRAGPPELSKSWAAMRAASFPPTLTAAELADAERLARENPHAPWSSDFVLRLIEAARGNGVGR